MMPQTKVTVRVTDEVYTEYISPLLYSQLVTSSTGKFWKNSVRGITIPGPMTTHLQTISHEWVYGHSGPKTLRTQDISALCVWCQSVSNFCVRVLDSSAQQCRRHFGPRTKRCFECRHCVKKCRPTLYSLL